MREFDGGATRDDDDGKYDFNGFESPLVRHAFAKYMHAHRTQADGKVRDSDNWKQGMGLDVYMKSFVRHAFTVEALHEGYLLTTRDGHEPETDIQQAILATIFNLNGYLHEYLTMADAVLDAICDVDPADNPMLQLDRASDADWIVKYSEWREKERARDAEWEKGGHSTEAERAPLPQMEAYERHHMVDLQSRLQCILDRIEYGTEADEGGVLSDIHDIATGEDKLDDRGDENANDKEGSGPASALPSDGDSRGCG